MVTKGGELVGWGLKSKERDSKKGEEGLRYYKLLITSQGR